MQNQNISNQWDLKRIIREFWNYRLFFIITLIVTLAAGYLYTRFSSETYLVKSSILIKTKRDYASTSSSEYLNVYDMIGQEITLVNEISVIQSTPIIKEVIEDMGTSVSYYLQEDKLPRQFEFSLKDIYDEAPFVVIIDQEHVQPLYALFYINILNEEEFSLASNAKDIWLFQYDNEAYHTLVNEINISGRYKFGETIQTDYCSFKLLLNSNYEPAQYINKDLFFRFNDVNELVKAYQNALEIESSSYESTIANISFIGDNIQKSLDFVNGIIAKYIEKDLEEKNYLATTTIQYIDRQLSSVADTLTQTEQQLQNFRRDYNIIDVNDRTERLYTQLETSENNKDEASRKLNLLQQVKAYFDANKENAQTIVLPSSMGIEDPLLNSLMEELVSLNSEKEQLIRNNQTRSPRLQILNVSIENLTGSISEAIDFSISSTTSELQEINNRIAELNDEFSRLPQTQRRLLGIERQFNLTQDVYTSLMEKRIQAQIARSSTLPDCEIIEPAIYQGIASPNKIISFGLSLFLGLLIPSSYIFGRILLTDKIEDKEDLKRYCPLTQIGELPEYRKSAGNVMVDDPSEVLAESFRSLRSNIDFFLLGEKHKIILITSSLPQEGKSISALNVATAFALSDNYTLLLKLDLRKTDEPDQDFSHQQLVGMSDYLIRQANLEDIIIQTETPNLDLITAGAIPPNPVELLTSDRTKDLLLQVKQRYDYIIIDTPPFGVVSDAFILMKYTDLNIFIVRLGLITTKTLIPSMEDITSKKMNNVYLLINGIKPSGSGYAKYTKYPYGKKNTSSRKKVIKPTQKKHNKITV